MSCPTLFVLGGLARRLAAAHLRIDSIEQAMRLAGVTQVGVAGYAVGQALAYANLTLGLSVVADCVNPVAASREGWASTALSAPARLVQVHLVCSDAAEHRRRVQERVADLDGHVLPNWEAVQGWEFEAWDGNVLRLETAKISPAKLVDEVIRHGAGPQSPDR